MGSASASCPRRRGSARSAQRTGSGRPLARQRVGAQQMPKRERQEELQVLSLAHRRSPVKNSGIGPPVANHSGCRVKASSGKRRPFLAWLAKSGSPPPKKTSTPMPARFSSSAALKPASSIRRISEVPPGLRQSIYTSSPCAARQWREKASENSRRIVSLCGVKTTRRRVPGAGRWVVSLRSSMGKAISSASTPKVIHHARVDFISAEVPRRPRTRQRR